MTNDFRGKIPLIDYPWHTYVDDLAEWSLSQSNHVKSFCFDLVMSLAYIDATSGLEKYVETCPNIAGDYNAHMGFINLCSPCYEANESWTFQKAAKPQSGAIGKLSSEIMLRLIKNLFPQFDSILAIGGTESADAVIQHKNGTVILAEVKSAPLLTYPIVFKLNQTTSEHIKVNLTSSQLDECESGLYMHDQYIIPLGKVKSDFWPFKPAIDFITATANKKYVDQIITTWLKSRHAYKDKNRSSKHYYLANASGHPPSLARTHYKWPNKESISDSKTSAGMDRTDDIKKGIYQVLKIGAQYIDRPEVRTAIISNLPAYRHGVDYVEPFLNMVWGDEKDLKDIAGIKAIERKKMKWVFDYIITLEEPVLRDLHDHPQP